MDHEAFEPLFQEELAALQAFACEALLSKPFVSGRRIVQAIDAVRTDGRTDRYVAIIDATDFPLYPFDVGFVDPRLTEPDAARCGNIKDPRWFPCDGETKFKTQFREAPHVFVCIQPGFSKEYFIHHRAEQWNPRYWTLARVVHQVQLAAREPTYQLPNWERA
jgi:hypothetical protein